MTLKRSPPTLLTPSGSVLLYAQQARQASGRKVMLKSGGLLFSCTTRQASAHSGTLNPGGSLLSGGFHAGETP